MPARACAAVEYSGVVSLFVSAGTGEQRETVSHYSLLARLNYRILIISNSFQLRGPANMDTQITFVGCIYLCRFFVRCRQIPALQNRHVRVPDKRCSLFNYLTTFVCFTILFYINYSIHYLIYSFVRCLMLLY